MNISITASRQNAVTDHSVNKAINKQGFGSKIPTNRMVQVKGSNRWYRVYDSFIANYDPNGVFNYSYIIRKGREFRVQTENGQFLTLHYSTNVIHY